MAEHYKDKSGQKEVILELLRQQPNSFARDFMAPTGMSSNRISMYLHRLMKLGLVTCDKTNGRGFARWTAVDLENVDLFPVRCTVLKEWTPHHVRDPLVAAIHGAAPYREAA